MKSIGFAFTSCTVPAKGTPTFDIGEGEMESYLNAPSDAPAFKVNGPAAAAETVDVEQSAQEVEANYSIETPADYADVINGLKF